ncbi:hypothetical protein RFI_29401 [Reticulomyxa filosa]|uniref:Uncharacterized protein n=1 Tax=Reticulomyxa filosa TaxID=46433 RepID=X6M2Z2_RETFI|nr:hypothetical protein RFI_29401 [Reticulomyxa filosa]|eukprot:ETO07991.1 hypothetical protein RFI_29401 [Reticulomyxa filosa]
MSFRFVVQYGWKGEEKILSEERWLFDNSMKSSFVLVALHVLNAFLVVPSANNWERDEWTNIFESLLQHEHINNIMNKLISCMWKLATSKCVKYLQFNDLVSVLVVQIFDNESVPLENDSIRILQSTLIIATNKSKKSLFDKTLAINIPPSTSMIERLNGKKIYVHEKKSELSYSKRYEWRIELIISTIPSNEDCKLYQHPKANIHLKHYLRSTIPHTMSLRTQNSITNTTDCRGNLSFKCIAVQSKQTPISNTHKVQRHIQTLVVCSVVRSCNVKFFLLFFFFLKKKLTNKQKNLDRSYDKADTKVRAIMRCCAKWNIGKQRLTL